MLLKKYFTLWVLLVWTTELFGQSLLADHKVMKVRTGFKFVEGPVADASGNLYFSDILDSKIYQLTTDGDLSVFLTDTEWGNGLFIKNDSLYVCHAQGLQVSRFSLQDRQQEILASSFEGAPFNGPNDLWVTEEGGIYFSDPDYSNKDNLELEAVYYIHPNGKITVADDDLVRPNGLTHNGQYLYVLDHGAKRTWKYRIRKDGTLRGKRVFVNQGGDGATSDSDGNVYLTNLVESSVDIFDEEGVLLAKIPVPEMPSNVAFAGKDLDELYITARSSLYRVMMNVKGRKAP